MTSKKTTKKTIMQARLLWTLSVLLLLCMISAGCGSKEEAKYSGELDGLKWSIGTSGKLTVTGTLETGLPEWGWREIDGKRHWDFRNAPWYEYREEVVSADMSFGGAESLYGLLSDFPQLKEADLTGTDMSKVTDITYMFTHSSNLETVSFKGCNLENLETVNNTFLGCTSLSEADFTNVKTSSKLTNLFGMFQGCTSLKNLDLSSFDTSGNPDMTYMFYQCSSLEEVLVNENWSPSADTINMFDECGIDQVTIKK